jgi:hypothetical protein
MSSIFFFRTVIVPSKSTIKMSNDASDMIEKRISIIDDEPILLASPKWHPSIDEEHFDSRAQFSLPTNQRSSDDLRQMIMQVIRRNSYQDGQKHDESAHNLIYRKRHRNSTTDISHENNKARLSLRSISYGFSLGTKTWSNLHDRNKMPYENMISSSPNYRLPANKIELDINQQDTIRRTGSFKRKSDII